MMNFLRLFFSLLVLTGASSIFAAEPDATPSALMSPPTMSSPPSALPAPDEPISAPATTAVNRPNLAEPSGAPNTNMPPATEPATTVIENTNGPTEAQLQLLLATIQAHKRAEATAKAKMKVAHAPLPPARPLTYEQGQALMLSTVPTMPVSDESNIAFDSLIKQKMPMSPQQVVKLRQLIDVAQRASAVTRNVPPKSVSSTLMINLAPGATPPAVRLSQGYVSSLVFVDSTGAPWPIESFDIGNPKSVNVQWDGKTNIILIQAISPYIAGDLVIRLIGLPTPITLELVSVPRVVDYRVDIHVTGIGPNTKELPVGTDLPSSANQLLLGVLDGMAPPGSKALNVGGASNTQVWLLGEKMYLRTRFTVLSPGWVSKMVSPDGMTAYELPKTSSVLVSRYGEPVQLKIEGF
jgi:intracellular multiplication protein IcmK